VPPPISDPAGPITWMIVYGWAEANVVLVAVLRAVRVVAGLSTARLRKKFFPTSGH